MTLYQIPFDSQEQKRGIRHSGGGRNKGDAQTKEEGPWRRARTCKAELDWPNSFMLGPLSSTELQYMPLSLRNCISSSRLVRKPVTHLVQLHYFAPVSTMASGFPPSAVRDMASQVSVLLKERSETVCVAETVRSASPASFLTFASPQNQWLKYCRRQPAVSSPPPCSQLQALQRSTTAA